MHQRDGHSCLIFAANVARHFILPTQIPLLRAQAAAKKTNLNVHTCDAT